MLGLDQLKEHYAEKEKRTKTNSRTQVRRLWCIWVRDRVQQKQRTTQKTIWGRYVSPQQILQCVQKTHGPQAI